MRREFFKKLTLISSYCQVIKMKIVRFMLSSVYDYVFFILKNAIFLLNKTIKLIRKIIFSIYLITVKNFLIFIFNILFH